MHVHHERQQQKKRETIMRQLYLFYGKATKTQRTTRSAQRSSRPRRTNARRRESQRQQSDTVVADSTRPCGGTRHKTNIPPLSSGEDRWRTKGRRSFFECNEYLHLFFSCNIRCFQVHPRLAFQCSSVCLVNTACLSGGHRRVMETGTRQRLVLIVLLMYQKEEPRGD